MPVYPGECGGWVVRPLFTTSAATRRPTCTCFQGNSPHPHTNQPFPNLTPWALTAGVLESRGNCTPPTATLEFYIYNIWLPLLASRPCFVRHFLVPSSVTHMHSDTGARRLNKATRAAADDHVGGSPSVRSCNDSKKKRGENMFWALIIFWTILMTPINVTWH